MDQVYLANRCSDLDKGVDSLPISGVQLQNESGETIAEAGDSTGRVLVQQYPYDDNAEAVATYMLKRIKGYVQKGYTAQETIIDPAAQLGDGILLNGMYGVLANEDITFDGLYTSDLSSPDTDETDDEYPYKSKAQRQMERNMAVTRSLIKKSSDAITLRVEEIDSDLNDLSGNFTELKVTVDGVTIKDATGTTLIKGSSIQTETIKANAISAEQVNLTGAIVWDDFASSTKSRIDSGKGDTNPSYIKSTYIDQTTIVSPDIYAGIFAATGRGVNLGDASKTQAQKAAYYIYDGVTGSGGNTKPTNLKGYISYDVVDDEVEDFEGARNRIIMYSNENIALKLEAGGDMSFKAQRQIYVHTPFTLAPGLYGTELPSASDRPIGSLFFLKQTS